MMARMIEDKSSADALPVAVLEPMARALRVLGHVQRLQILDTLDRVGELPVHEITAAIGAPQAATSLHLGKLREAGLIAAARRGQEVWYRIADPNALTILGCIRRKARAS